MRPEYDYQNPGQRIIGYVVNSNLRVTTKELDKVNQIIDLSTGAGANQIEPGSTNFTYSVVLSYETL